MLNDSVDYTIYKYKIVDPCAVPLWRGLGEGK